MADAVLVEAVKRRRQGSAPLELLAQGQPWDRPERDEDISLQLYRLLTGFDHFGECGDRKAARELWESVQGPFLAGHVERRPGTRPWAWWEFDAPEPRRMLEGSPERISPAAVTWMGAPSAHACAFESSIGYLDRIGGWLKGERRELGPRLAGTAPDMPHRHAVDPEALDPATAYAHDVIVGEVSACNAIRWACQRHLDDLENAWRDGFFWDRRALHYRIAFSRYVRHYQGLCPGEVFRPEPWQWFVTGSVYGWMSADGTRRFRDALVFIPRKNGKTFMMAESFLFALEADGERGAEIRAAATKRDQAAKSVIDALGIRLSSPVIRARTSGSRMNIRGTKELHCERSMCSVKTLSADATSELGGNIHFGGLDEIAAYRTGDMATVMRGGTAGRRQPIVFSITTAGTDAEGYGAQEYETAKKVLDPEQPDFRADRRFLFVAELDDREAWRDPERWAEANPNLGVSVDRVAFAGFVEAAENDPTKVSDLLVYHFDVWAETADTWLPWEVVRQDGSRGGWKWCAQPGINAIAWRRETLERLEGERVALGLDISSKIDLTALIALFVDTDPLIAIPWFWIPEEVMVRRAKEDRVPFPLWARQGFLAPTPGEQIDQDAIYNLIVGTDDAKGLGSRFEVLDVGVDPWNAGELTRRLRDAGVETTDVPQTIARLSEPSQKLEALVASSGLDHGHNPLLAWNARNATARRDSNGNIAPDKKPARRARIDGISALVNALHRMIHAEAEMEPEEWISYPEENKA